MQHHAGGEQLVAAAPCENVFGGGEFRGGVHAEQGGFFAARAFGAYAAHVHARGKAESDEIGDVVFSAAVVAGKMRQQAAHRGQRKEIDARVHLAGVFEGTVEGGIEVFGLHDGAHGAVLADHAAVGCGVVQLEAQKGHVRAFCGGEKVIEHVGGEQGGVAVHHEHAAVAFKVGHGGHEGVPGAELPFLTYAAGRDAEPFGGASGFGGNHVGLVAHEGEHAAHAGHGGEGGRHQREHGFAEKRLQHLGPGRGHARTPACGKNEGVYVVHVSLHAESVLRRRWPRRGS